MIGEPVTPDGELSAELLKFAREVRGFATAKLAPHARRIDEQATFRRDSVDEMARAGIVGGPISTRYGGAGWDAMQLVVAHEEIGAVCGNSRGFLAVQTGLVAQCIEQNGSEEQKRLWLPRLTSGEIIGCFGLTEEDAGSDVAALATRAEQEGDHYLLSGKKIWITNGGVADVAIVFATVDPARGRDGITAFIVATDTPGLTRTPMPGVELGHRGSDHAELRFDGMPAPASGILGGVGNGFEVAMRGLTAGRLSVAAGAVGIHRAALAASIEFVTARRQFGKPIAAFQMVQERIADMTVELMAARALVYRCARRRDTGIEHPRDLAAAKLYSTEAAARAAEQAVLLHGGRGYSSAYPVERFLRDIMGLRIYEGTSMIQKTILARSVLPRKS